MELRLLTRKKRITADMVRLYASEHDISPMTAKRELEGLTSHNQLQYRESSLSPWQDIPSIIEYYE